MTPGYGFGFGWSLRPPGGGAAAWTPGDLSDLVLWLRPEELDNPNRLLQTEDFEDAAWTNTTVTLTSGQTDPDGGSTAFLAEPAAAGSKLTQNAQGFQAGADDVMSLYWKRGPGHNGTSTARLRIDDGVGTTQVLAVPAATWERIPVTQTLDGSATRAQFQFYPDTVTGTESVYIWHPQLESGTSATTYVANAATAGGIVSQWDDVSGHNRHVIQGVQASMPLVEADVLDGWSAMLSDGVDDYVEKAFGLDIAQPGQVFIVAKSAVGGDGRVFSGSTSSTKRWEFFRDNANARARLFAGLTINGPNSGWPAATGHLWDFIADGVRGELRRDGVLSVSGDVGAYPLDGVTVGANYSGGSGMNVHVLEVLVIDAALTYDDNRNMLVYLNAKYPSLGISIPPESIDDIPSLYAWYQPEDLPTSGAVTTWENAVTPGTFDLVSDGATDPVVGTGVNSVRSILFSQLDTESLSTVESTNFTQPLSYFVVAMKASGTATVSLVDSNAGTNRCAVYDPSGDTHMYLYAGTQRASNLIALDGLWKIHESLFDGATSRIFLTENEGTIGNPGAGSQDGLRIGLNGIGTGPWDGEVCEVIFFDGELSEIERDRVNSYLKEKYSL